MADVEVVMDDGTKEETGLVQVDSDGDGAGAGTEPRTKVLAPRRSRTPPGEASSNSQVNLAMLEAKIAEMRNSNRNDTKRLLAQQVKDFEAITEKQEERLQEAIAPVMTLLSEQSDKLDKVQRDCDELGVGQQEMQKRLEALEALASQQACVIQELTERSKRVEEVSSVAKGTTEDLQRSLRGVREEMAMAAESVPPPRPPLPGWDREVDQTVLIANSQALFVEAELDRAIERLLVRCNIPREHVRLDAPRGQTAAQRWTIRFLGEPRLAARRAAQVFAALRGADGEWMSLEVMGTTGMERSRLYLGLDKSPKQTRVEVMGKRLASLARSLRPELRWRLLREEGVVCVGFQRVLKVIVEPDSSKLQFAAEGIRDHGIDKDMFVRRWEAEAAPRSAATWGS